MSARETVLRAQPDGPARAAPAWDVAYTAGLVGGVFLLWEVAVRLTHTPPYILPAPSRVLQALAQMPGFYASAALVTMAEALGGLVLGVGVGTAIAVLITFREGLARGVLALAILVKATPLVAIAPLLTIWLGFGAAPKVIITGLITFFPVLVNVHAGLHGTDPATLALLHSLHATEWEVLRYARWPSALPYLFAALKVTAPLALVGAVVAEWTGASAGLGRLMWLAYTNLNLPMLFAAVFCLATMGVGLYTLVGWLERRVVFWQAETAP